MPEKDGYCFAIVREKTGRYISQIYENETDFRKQLQTKHGSLLIMIGISREAAEKECREYNDRHFPIEGLEKWIIQSKK